MRSALAIAALSLPMAFSGCAATQAFDAPFADYQQRTIMVATTGGNSLAANTALQTATPWPRYANDTNIPADGARMAKVVKRYESGASDSGAQAPSYGGAGGTAERGMNGASTGLGMASFATRLGAAAAMTRRPVCKMTAALVLARMRSLRDDCDGSALVEATIVIPSVGQPLSRRVRILLVLLQSATCRRGSARRRALHDPNRTHQRQQRSVRPEGSERRPLHGRGGEHCDHCPARRRRRGASHRLEARPTSQSAALPSAALDNGRYADGSTSMTIIDVATSFADPSLGLFSDSGSEGADAVLLPSRAIPGARLMSMSSFIARLTRDEDGGPLVEVAIILPILITFLFGGVDFMNALYQWNAAAKAAEIGARIAAVSDPVASGLNSIPDNVLSSSVASGSPMPDFTVACDGGAAACACVSGACDGMGSYSAAAMGLIVYGRAGKETCTPPPPSISPACATLIRRSRRNMSRSFMRRLALATPAGASDRFRRSRFRSTPPRPRPSCRSNSSSCLLQPSTYRRLRPR